MVTQKESSLQYSLHSQVYCFVPWTPFSVSVPLGAATSPMGYWALSRRRGEQGIARTDTNVCLAGKASRPSSDFKKMICHDNDGLQARNQIRRKWHPLGPFSCRRVVHFCSGPLVQFLPGLDIRTMERPCPAKDMARKLIQSIALIFCISIRIEYCIA